MQDCNYLKKFTLTLLLVTQQGGNSIVSYYNSHQKAIMSIYSEYNWQPWRFDKTPNG